MAIIHRRQSCSETDAELAHDLNDVISIGATAGEWLNCPLADRFSFSVTGYTGHEDQILEIRNRNRRTKQSREYLDWRYLGETSPTPPTIFWMRENDGPIVAMASLIFRPYAVNGETRYFAVLGDISVNEECRGEGLSRKLFGFMNNHIRKARIPVAFVMPNKAAENALRTAGWTTIGKLVPRIFVARPWEKCKAILKIDALARLVCWGLELWTGAAISFQMQPGLSLQPVETFDQEFQTFWERLPKAGMIMRERSVSALTWRYRKQPDAKFSIGKFYYRGTLVGYVVSSIDEEKRMCLISDFVVIDWDLFKPCMALFVRRAVQNPNVVTVRIVFTESSPYARQLWKMGFIPRGPVTAFQAYHTIDSRLMNPGTWFVTAGDKDA